LARDVGADVDEELADRLALEHLVEAARTQHLGRGHLDELRCRLRMADPRSV
jgi:hypothetical protein